MADIRKRTGAKGTTYQVRYPSSKTKSGYAYATFNTMKEARAFLESGRMKQTANAPRHELSSVHDAIEKWLRICEKEGTDGNEPVTIGTLKTYIYLSRFMKAYPWDKTIQELKGPDIVKFRSWLIENCPSRYLARKTLTYFHTVLNEMALRGYVESNVASGISISTRSRYDRPVTPPSMEDFYALLTAADRLANSKNAQIARAWERNRPMLYLAGDTGMRPGEYLALPRYNLLGKEVKVDRAVERTGHKISVTKTPAGIRHIDMSPETAHMVAHYAKHVSPSNAYDLVFPTSTGRWQTAHNWRKLGFASACLEAGLVKTVERAGKTVEVPKYSPYDLRHFYASVLIDNKVNLKQIQRLMGHTNIATTLSVYGHLIERAEAVSDSNVGLLNILNQRSCGKSVAKTP